MFLNGRRIKKNLDYSLIFKLTKFIHSQNVGITWGFILLRLTSMFPYSITSLNIIKIHVQFFYRPASSCSSSSMSRSNLPFPKGWMEDLELFNWPISSIGC